MNNTPLKMVWIVFNIAIETEVKAILQKLNIDCYTEWPRLIGKGQSTGPKLDNNVWPGANGAFMIATTADKASQLMDAIRALRDEIGTHEGVKAFLTPLEDITGDL